MTPDRQRRVAEWTANQAARAAFDALPRPAFIDLSKLSDHDLSEIIREREVAFQNVLGEAEKRSASNENPEWSEQKVAAALGRKRQGEKISLRVRINDLPPPLFRMGYEWATMTLLDVLSGFLSHPSEDIVELTELEPVGRDLWRKKKNSTPKVFDPRRRAAFDLINILQNYTSNQQRSMFTAYKLRTTYDPADDAKLATPSPPEHPEGT